MTVMLRCWRIAADTPDYTADDLSGTGAKVTGGRWNRAGIPVLYASSSISLAYLETLIHLGAGGLPMNRYLVQINIPIGVWKAAKEFDPAIHVGWDAIPIGKVSLDFGDKWVASKSSTLLKVPSVIVPQDRNFVINPAHPGAAGITATKLQKWTYDGRLAAAAPVPKK